MSSYSKERSQDYLNLSYSSDEENNKTINSKFKLRTSKKPLKRSTLKQSELRELMNKSPKKTRSGSLKSHKTSQSMFINVKSNDESIAKKKKRCSPRSTVKICGITIPCPSTTCRQLQNEHLLRTKMNSLHRSIKSQEKTLKKIQRKITDEKADLSMIKNKFNQKIKKEVLREENSVLVSSLLSQYASEKENEKQKKFSLSFSKNGKIVTLNKPKKDENKVENEEELEKDWVPREKRKSSDNYKSKGIPHEDLKDKKEKLEEESSLGFGILQPRTYNKDALTIYEPEMERLKAEIERIQEENFKMKCQVISLKDYENTEDLYSKKIKELEETVSQKEREIAEREGYYKGQIEDIMTKMEELQNEVAKMGDYRGKVDQMSEQLRLKEKELEMIKKYYFDKPQHKNYSIANKKRGQSKTYSELVSEIRHLKAEVDMLENDKLSSSKISSSFISRDDSDIISSKIISQF